MLGHHMQALRETIGGKGDYKGRETRKLVMQAIYKKRDGSEGKKEKIYLADAHQDQKL